MPGQDSKVLQDAAASTEGPVVHAKNPPKAIWVGFNGTGMKNNIQKGSMGAYVQENLADKERYLTVLVEGVGSSEKTPGSLRFSSKQGGVWNSVTAICRGFWDYITGARQPQRALTGAMGMGFLYGTGSDIQIDTALKRLEGSNIDPHDERMLQEWAAKDVEQYDKSSLIEAATGQDTPIPIVLWGYSRGAGLSAIALAHRLNKKYPNVPVYLCLHDPNAGDGNHNREDAVNIPPNVKKVVVTYSTEPSKDSTGWFEKIIKMLPWTGKLPFKTPLGLDHLRFASEKTEVFSIMVKGNHDNSGKIPNIKKDDPETEEYVRAEQMWRFQTDLSKAIIKENWVGQVVRVRDDERYQDVVSRKKEKGDQRLLNGVWCRGLSSALAVGDNDFELCPQYQQQSEVRSTGEEEGNQEAFFGRRLSVPADVLSRSISSNSLTRLDLNDDHSRSFDYFETETIDKLNDLMRKVVGDEVESTWSQWYTLVKAYQYLLQVSGFTEWNNNKIVAQLKEALGFTNEDAQAEQFIPSLKTKFAGLSTPPKDLEYVYFVIHMLTYEVRQLEKSSEGTKEINRLQETLKELKRSTKNAKQKISRTLENKADEAFSLVNQCRKTRLKVRQDSNDKQDRIIKCEEETNSPQSTEQKVHLTSSEETENADTKSPAPSFCEEMKNLGVVSLEVYAKFVFCVPAIVGVVTGVLSLTFYTTLTLGAVNPIHVARSRAEGTWTGITDWAERSKPACFRDDRYSRSDYSNNPQGKFFVRKPTSTEENGSSIVQDSSVENGQGVGMLV